MDASLEDSCVSQTIGSSSPKLVKKKVIIVPKSVILTTKKALELLLSGTLQDKVCRFCLNITSPLSELDQIMEIAGRGALYKVTIRAIVASFHPYKIVDDPNIPNKICEKCLGKALQSYLFAQKCEQSERALRNCFEDMYEKLEKLDPLERTKKRGRQKLHPNHNILYAENRNIIDYAEPIRHLVNIEAESLTKQNQINEFECKKCWQVLPDLESLLNHEKIHPKSMWYNCRLCGKSFAKNLHINRHLRQHAKLKTDDKFETGFPCKLCGFVSENSNEHLQHIETHKFKTVLEHVVEKNMDKLCSVCFDKGKKLVDMDKMICLHGGYPELTGDRNLYTILGSTVPEPNYKYQELYIAHNPKILTISKKPIKEIFKYSLPVILSVEKINGNMTYTFKFSNLKDQNEEILNLDDEQRYTNENGEDIQVIKLPEEITRKNYDIASIEIHHNVKDYFSEAIFTAENMITEVNNDIEGNVYTNDNNNLDENMNPGGINVDKNINITSNILIKIEEENDNTTDSTITTIFAFSKPNYDIDAENTKESTKTSNKKMLCSNCWLNKKSLCENCKSIDNQAYEEKVNKEIFCVEIKNAEIVNTCEDKASKEIFSKEIGNAERSNICEEISNIEIGNGKTSNTCKEEVTKGISSAKIEYVDGNKLCHVCWLFQKVGKCDYCRKPTKNYLDSDEKNETDEATLENQSKVENIEITDDLVKTQVVTNGKKRKLLPEAIYKVKRTKWQCNICLTTNYNDRETCLCCESKYINEDPVKINFIPKSLQTFVKDNLEIDDRKCEVDKPVQNNKFELKFEVKEDLKANIIPENETRTKTDALMTNSSIFGVPLLSNISILYNEPSNVQEETMDVEYAPISSSNIPTHSYPNSFSLQSTLNPSVPNFRPQSTPSIFQFNIGSTTHEDIYKKKCRKSYRRLK